MSLAENRPIVLPACRPGRGGTTEVGDNGLVTEQYSRGFLVGGGSVKPRYGLFSASSLRLYFCLPPRTRSRRTPVMEGKIMRSLIIKYMKKSQNSNNLS